VLIVEDANFNLHAERITLESWGYRVINTPEGASGVRMARAHQPDLIVLDLGLPDMPGTWVIEELKRDDTTREIPILVCTADEREETRRTCFASGCDAYLLKPFSAEQLLDAVGRVLSGSSDGEPHGPTGLA
jgi:CheY-like chemotaxis protein